MRKKNFKGRCEKRMIGKCAETCRTYDPIQYAYADLLQASDEISEISGIIISKPFAFGESAGLRSPAKTVAFALRTLNHATPLALLACVVVAACGGIIMV